MKKIISTKNRVFIPLVGLGESRESQLIYQWLKNDTFQPKLIKFGFPPAFPTTLRCNAEGNRKQ